MSKLAKQFITVLLIAGASGQVHADTDQLDTNQWPMGMQIAYQGDQALDTIQKTVLDQLPTRMQELMLSSLVQNVEQAQLSGNASMPAMSTTLLANLAAAHQS